MSNLSLQPNAGGTILGGRSLSFAVYPSYISTSNVLFDGIFTKTIVFVAGPPAVLMRWDQMDDHVKADVDYFIAQHGGAGSLPWTLTNFMLYAADQTILLSNGQSFLDTYVKSLKYVDIKPVMAPSPVNRELVYYNGTAWKYLFNDGAV